MDYGLKTTARWITASGNFSDKLGRRIVSTKTGTRNSGVRRQGYSSWAGDISRARFEIFAAEDAFAAGSGLNEEK